LALEVIARLNTWRVSEELWPLKPNETLEELAHAQAEHLLSQSVIPSGSEMHLGPGGESPVDRALAADWASYHSDVQTAIIEIAARFAEPEDAINWWRSSEVHRNAATDAGFREVGVAALPAAGGGNLYVVVLGSRPDVLPVLLDPVGEQLYLSSEQYRFGLGGDWIYGVTQYQMLASADSAPDDGAWLDWQLSIPAPDGGTPYYVALSDGERQVVTEVQPGVDVAWLLENLPEQ
jgi:hypothetical protein